MIAILSDVHGNLPALDAVLARVEALGCDAVYSLGDVAGYGCFINECVDRIRARCAVHLMGNHDHYLASGRPCPRSNSANVCLDYQRRTITPENLGWLAASPLSLRAGDLSMVHAGWSDPVDEYLDRVDAGYFGGRPGRFFFSGHTHVQLLADFGAQVYCNPGSVGQPRDGDPRAAFATFDGGRVALERVDYDLDAIADAMDRAGFSAHYYGHLYKGSKIGGALAEVRVG